MSAFGQAMMDSINTGTPQDFQLNCVGDGSIKVSCSDYLELRTEEKKLFDGLDLGKTAKLKVLDYGCGVGRHLKYVQQLFPTAECCGVETCDLLLEHCRRTIGPPSRFEPNWSNFKDENFELILLMGNGLGVLGDKTNATDRLKDLVDSLQPSGAIIIESGNPFGSGYSAESFTIHYKGQTDAPFTWGNATKEWVKDTLCRLGCTPFKPIRSTMLGDFYITVGKRTP